MSEDPAAYGIPQPAEHLKGAVAKPPKKASPGTALVAIIALFIGGILGTILGANSHRYEFQAASYSSVLRCDKWSGTVERVHANH
jgi:hypothetical protein